ncbi:hypothetical protein MPER_11124 [Moniliophthora perniciosa FA553]|nr:hypothetical protein MPER_11124 [Moniliophthora perniciosa FA553]
MPSPPPPAKEKENNPSGKGRKRSGQPLVPAPVSKRPRSERSTAGIPPTRYGHNEAASEAELPEETSPKGGGRKQKTKRQANKDTEAAAPKGKKRSRGKTNKGTDKDSAAAEIS